MVKNYLKYLSKMDEKSNPKATTGLIVCLVLFPIIVLPFVRLFLLRRARNLEWVSHGQMQKVKEARKQMRLNLSSGNQVSQADALKYSNMFKMQTKYCLDIKNALRFWDSTPLIDIYFNQSSEEVELASIQREIRKTMRTSETDIAKIFDLDTSE